MAMTETEANILFDILVEHAGHSNHKGYDRFEFVSKFTDADRQHGEYWFTGKFNDFKLIEQWELDGRKRWHMIKQGGQPHRRTAVFKALNDTNAAIRKAYASKALTGEGFTMQELQER